MDDDVLVSVELLLSELVPPGDVALPWLLLVADRLVLGALFSIAVVLVLVLVPVVVVVWSLVPP